MKMMCISSEKMIKVGDSCRIYAESGEICEEDRRLLQLRKIRSLAELCVVLIQHVDYAVFTGADHQTHARQRDRTGGTEIVILEIVIAPRIAPEVFKGREPSDWRKLGGAIR